jgi:hypothetical protein
VDAKLDGFTAKPNSPEARAAVDRKSAVRIDDQEIGFPNFDTFQSDSNFGPARPGYAWHHLVNQNEDNIKAFKFHAKYTISSLVSITHPMLGKQAGVASAIGKSRGHLTNNTRKALIVYWKQFENTVDLTHEKPARAKAAIA